MPYPIPFIWNRTRKTAAAFKSNQQNPPLWITARTVDDKTRLLTVQQYWMTQQRYRDWSMRVWYARSYFAGRSIPSLTVQAQALGTGDGQGAEIVDNDYILARLSGGGGYTGIGTAPFTISSTEIQSNSYFDVDFRFAVPNTASTLGRFLLYLVWDTEEDIAWFGDDSDPLWFEHGGFYGSVDLTNRVAFNRSRVTVLGHIHTETERTDLAAGGLDLPADVAF